MAAESKLTGAFNIGLGKSTTINQLVEMINEIIGKDVKPVYEKERPGDIKYSLADISKAKALGYDPKADFKEELTETVDWFRKILI
jgi:UDP-glucose 4-epimerase